MKKYSQIFAIAVGAFLFTGNTSAYFNVSTIPGNNKSIVEITVADNIKTSLFIYNPQGIIIHDEIIEPGQKNTKLFDLSNFGDGVYSFNSEMDYINTTKEIEVKNSSAEVISKVVEFSPVFTMEGDNLLINFLNIDQENIILAIESDYMVYHEGFEGSSATYHKMLNVGNLPWGEYSAMLTVGERTFRHTFKVY